MKRIQIAITAAIFFAVATYAAPAARANGQTDMILRNMQAASSKIKTFYARMVQQKVNKQLGGRPETHRGEVFFKRGGPNNDKVKVKYDNGQEAIVNGNKIILIQPQIKQCVETTRSAQASKNQEFAFIATPYSSVPQLKAQYDVNHRGDEGGLAVLDLTPKNKSASFTKAVLWVDRSSWLPTKYQVTQRNGEVSTFSLSNMSFGSIADGLFSTNCPSGFTRVRQ